jgi:hypothetical protein
VLRRPIEITALDMERPVIGNGFSFFPPEEVVQAAVEEALRRLLTQIFAGRCRIIVIRRELPRTICAGWSKDFLHNAAEDSPSRGLQVRNLYYLHYDFLGPNIGPMLLDPVLFFARLPLSPQWPR